MDTGDSNEGAGSLPPKRLRLECIIHCSDDNTDKLVSLQNIDSWRTLLRAAEIQKHIPVLELAQDLPDGQIPTIWYHRKCRSLFTMKKRLDGILAKEQSGDSEPTQDKGSVRSPRQGPSIARTYDAECIFCQNTNKYTKGQMSRENLVQCRELRADAKIRGAATKKMDIRILAIVSRDIVAAEGHYHRSCYRLYTKEVAKGDVSIDEKDADGDDVEDMYNAAANQSYNELSLFLRKELFDNPQVMTMADLSSRLVDSMNCFGIDQVKEDTKKHIKRKLESEFGGALHIFPDRKGRLIMYPDNMSMCELAKENQSLKAELHTPKGITADDVVAKAAMKIRADIKQQDAPQTWPPEVESEAQHAIVPESTMDFLRYLLTGYNDPGHASQRVQRLLRSFAHDMVYAVTGGQTKPPKHIVLAFTVKSLTGNVELINVLNRLGHSISYSQMEEIDTALCLQKLSLADRSR